MTVHSDAARAYRESTFENAPPLKILRLLYQGALRFMGEARAIEEPERGPERVALLHRAQAVVAELRCTLEHVHAPELSGDLDKLYEFVESEIRRAMTERGPEPIDNGSRVLATLLEGWKNIEIRSEGLAGEH